MIAEEITIEWDEGGCYLVIVDEEGSPRGLPLTHRFRVEDPEQLYDRVKAAILPWLMERDEALREYRLMSAAVEADAREAYDLSDPKHPTYHERMSALSDDRDAFTIWQEEDR